MIPISVKSAMGMVAISLGLLSLPQAASASPITYTVNQLIGPGSATGTLTTDGTIGVLAAANIIGWNLFLNDGSYTTTLVTTPGNVFVNGSGLTASLTTMTFMACRSTS